MQSFVFAGKLIDERQIKNNYYYYYSNYLFVFIG